MGNRRHLCWEKLRRWILCAWILPIQTWLVTLGVFQLWVRAVETVDSCEACCRNRSGEWIFIFDNCCRSRKCRLHDCEDELNTTQRPTSIVSNWSGIQINSTAVWLTWFRQILRWWNLTFQRNDRQMSCRIINFYLFWLQSFYPNNSSCI